MSTFGSVFELSSLTGANGFQINGEAADDSSGSSVANAGDINGDGFDDLIIGAYSANLNGINSGASYVVFGAAGGFAADLNLSTLNGSNGFQINGEAANHNSGRSVATAGDVNGDGFDDVIIGAFGAGASYVVFGKAGGFGDNLNLSTLNGTNGFQINGEALGDTVASAGDVNGDGFDDLIIGAFGANPNGTFSGASYVVFGKAGGFAADLNLSALNGANGFKINGEAAGDYSGMSVASAGDVNGDGFDDLIIGARLADPNGFNSGASYVVFGATGAFSADLNLSSLNGINGFQISGEASRDYSGISVASAGDVNGDGFDDLIIGASGADPNGAGSGASYVVFGAAGGFAANLNLSTLNGTNGFQISGEVAVDYFGRSVASAGDINGDGFDDLIIGAWAADPNGNYSGATYVVFGAAGSFAANLNLSILNGTNGFQINGEVARDFSGSRVASAGDINGDGFDDLIIGADGADPNGSASGASYVIFGRAPNLAVSHTGTAADNTIIGGSLNDTLNGLAGDDTLYGAVGDDIIYGETGDDLLDGGAGDDLMYGGAGNDLFILDSAGDIVFDTSGIDEVRATFSLNLADAAFAVMENAGLLGAGDLALTGSAGDNVLTGNGGRNAIVGGLGNDTLAGDGGNDVLDGGAGNDIMFGGAGRDSVISGTGNDTLIGGAGQDRLTGGAGRDVFEFISMRDMTTRERTTDVITDFRRGQDKIDLSDIDASTVRPTDDAFLFRGKAAIGANTAGEVSYKQFNLAGRKNDYTLVYIDTDGDRAAEGVIKVMGLHSFTAGDFIL